MNAATSPAGLTETPAQLMPRDDADTVLIACAALGKEVRELIRKHDWHVDLRVINAKLHMMPRKIGPAVDDMLTKTAGRYEHQVVIYGHCGAMDLDDVIAKHGAVRTVGPHCYEMFGGEAFAEALKEQPGTFILTDFLVKAWETLAVKGLKMDKHPKLKDLFFANYTRMIYFVQENDETLVAEAWRIANWVGLPLEILDTGYGDLEGRLVAIMTNTPQPTTSLTYDPYSPDPSG
jgi:hypothetical protein